MQIEIRTVTIATPFRGKGRIAAIDVALVVQLEVDALVVRFEMKVILEYLAAGGALEGILLVDGHFGHLRFGLHFRFWFHFRFRFGFRFRIRLQAIAIAALLAPQTIPITFMVLLRRSIAADQRIGEAMLQCLETERYIQSMGMGTGTKACQDLGLDAAHRRGIHATG